MAQLTIQQAFDVALQHHQAGRLQEAEQLYGQILAQQPKHAGAMHLLGVIAHQMGRNDLAVDLIRRALALDPNYAEAHSNLGNVLKDNGQLDEAVAACRRAIALKPGYADAHNNLGNALIGKGRLEEAIDAFRRAIALNPNLSGAHNNLGNALKDKGQLEEAIGAYRQAIALRPNYYESHTNLGAVLIDEGQLDEAIAACRQAIVLRPDYAEAHINLGNAVMGKGRLEEAIAAYRQAIALRPNYAEAYNNLGNALKDQGQLEEAIGAFRQAIDFDPDLPQAHNNYSYALLGRGDLAQGWKELEWRWKCNFSHSPRRDFTQPQWDGCSLEARTILLQTEQFFGDALQFIRYFHTVAEQGGTIVIECQAELQRLFQTMARGCQVVARGQPLPAFDLHCPLLSLPRIFGTTLANIPNTVPYLHADAEDAGSWQQRLSDHRRVVKVGLVWAGSPTRPNDHNRSMKLARLAPLGHAPGVSFFSLQKGDAAAEAKTPPPGMELIDWTEELKDFANTAALIANLDLVIAVDTAVAHLAGAMGKTVWLLVPFPPDWRWLLDRADSPWYPTMRLFRQETPGDWDSVIGHVAGELLRYKSKRG